MRSEHQLLRLAREETHTRHEFSRTKPPDGITLTPRAAASIVNVKTDIRPRLVQRHGKPILGTESDRIALPLLLDPESRHNFRGLVGLTELDQARITRDQTDSDERLVSPGPVEGGEIRQLAMVGDSVVLDFGGLGPV